MSVHMLAAGSGRRFASGITVKVDTGQSPDFMIIESELSPRWAGPPPHVHGAYDEAFYVLDGSVRFAVDGSTRDCTSGSVVHVPRGSAHGFANPGSTTAKVLIVATPGALQLVEEIYQLIGDDGSFDPAAMVALYARHHSEILAPVGP